MLGIYFSGTGNSRYCLERFLKEYHTLDTTHSPTAFSIESPEVISHIQTHEEIVLSYPVQYSNIPKILRDFIIKYKDLWKGKKVFIIATMGLFSGDGSGMLGRLLKKYGATVIGGLHLKMPDSIGDEKALKRSLENNRQLIANANTKIKASAKALKDGHPTQEGIGIWYHLAGLFGQRLYFYNKTKNYSSKLKIDASKCVGCGKCVKLCPMQNITLSNKLAEASNQCTMCYRCVNDCPKQAITLLGKHVVEQSKIEKYL